MIPVVLALAAGALPILSGHSHNDYERDAPLLEALAAGLVSVEADVHLVGGELLVGHDEEDLEPGRTLESLYLEPLRRHAGELAGRVFPEPHALLLLVDVKSDAERTATYDGRLPDLEAATPPGFITLVSDDWEDHFAWRGRGPMPESDRKKLAGIVAAARERDWRVRFWKTPVPAGRPVEEVWSELLAAGVDLIGTDDPARYAAFARARER